MQHIFTIIFAVCGCFEVEYNNCEYISNTTYCARLLHIVTSAQRKGSKGEWKQAVFLRMGSDSESVTVRIHLITLTTSYLHLEIIITQRHTGPFAHLFCFETS